MAGKQHQGPVEPGLINRRGALKRLGAAAGLGLVSSHAASYRPRNTIPALGGPADRAGSYQLLRGIESVVVLMMENRSFDNLLGALAFDRDYPHAELVDGLSGGHSNPGPDGRPVFAHRVRMPEVASPLHDWDTIHATWNQGRCDRFVLANLERPRAQPLSHLDREHLPITYALADRFAVCDRWFASVMSPTWPNRFYLHAATAEGRRANRPIWDAHQPTIWERLLDAGLSGKNYYAGHVAWYPPAFLGKTLAGNDALVPERLDAFFRDARDGKLPPFALIDPDWSLSDNHPPHDLALGEALLASVVRALAESPQWPRTLFVLTYDEHGGFFDHVPPPEVVDPRRNYRRLGFRVPAVVMGPHVRAGVVSRRLEHVSIGATLAARFRLASLGARMDAAADLSACIDPVRLSDPAPPPRDLPPVPLPRDVIKTAMTAPRSWSQPEVRALAEGGRLPGYVLDPRDSAQRLAAWLRVAQDLRAVRVV